MSLNIPPPISHLIFLFRSTITLSWQIQQAPGRSLPCLVTMPAGPAAAPPMALIALTSRDVHMEVHQDMSSASSKTSVKGDSLQISFLPTCLRHRELYSKSIFDSQMTKQLWDCLPPQAGVLAGSILHSYFQHIKVYFLSFLFFSHNEKLRTFEFSRSVIA